MIATVFVGTSVDGFIARRDYSFDFLPAEPEPHGYEEFIASVDTLVIGRNTYDTVMSFDGWAYGKRRVVVLSSKPLDLATARSRGGVIEQMSGDPRDIAAKLEASGSKHAYVDGGVTVQRFLRAGLIQRLIITRVPVLIGDGIPLFGTLPHDIKLEHVMTRSFPSGLVQTEYRVL